MLDHHSLLQWEGFPWRWSAVRSHLHENSSADVQTSTLWAPEDEKLASLEGHSPGQHRPHLRQEMDVSQTGFSLAFEEHAEMPPGFAHNQQTHEQHPLAQLMGSHMALCGGWYQNKISWVRRCAQK